MMVCLVELHLGVLFFFYWYGGHPFLHVLTHAFPTRRSSDLFIHHDPPVHTAYRSLMQRIITPKRMLGIEQEIRALCARSLDPLVGKDYFDMIGNLGAEEIGRAHV